MSSSESKLIHDLSTLNKIAETLNRSVDMQTALQSTLQRLAEIMGLETAWVFLEDELAQEQWVGKGYRLAAFHNLPPALALDQESAWQGTCDCQALCKKGHLTDAYNEVHCTRLMASRGDRKGLAIHASVPLLSGTKVLGILNVAAPDWVAFKPQTLALFSNIGMHMGAAIERARLYDLLRERRIDEQAMLLDLSNQLLTRLDLDDLMTYLLQEMRRLLQADACTLLFPDEQSQSLVARAAIGWQYDPVKGGLQLPIGGDNGPAIAMRSQRPYLVEDISKTDTEWGSSHWLQAEGFRGHAVVPLIAEDRSVGSLVINMRTPRILSQDEVRFLQLMANQAAIALERSRLREEELQRHKLEEELAVARQIQLSLLPLAVPNVPGWEFAAMYQAARLVGGDFYDFLRQPDDNSEIGLLIADVAGKGVPAALFMALSRTIIRTIAFNNRTPAQVLDRANQIILQDSTSDLFLSAFYARFDPQSGHLSYANAGHNRPLWFNPTTGAMRSLAAKGIILGVIEPVELEEKHLEVEPGDVLVLYTDGVTEAVNEAWQEFGEQRLHAAVERAAHPQANADQILQGIMDMITEFTANTPQTDDITLVIIRRKPADKLL